MPVTLHNGESACIQIITPYFFAIVMAFRAHAKPEMVADTAWAHVPVAMPEAIAA
jgi:hypothetical protein